MQVNRYLKDKDMDRIDHALGRPVDPLAETYREYFAASPNTEVAVKLKASPHWTNGRVSCGMMYFFFTDAGREALRDHLREIGDPHRSFEITFEGHVSQIVAKSHGAAKYSHWLDISDIMPDLTFGSYCRRASVRLATVGSGER